MMLSRNRRLANGFVAAGVALGLHVAMPAHGQSDYPVKAVRMIVGSVPGGSGDIGARLLSSKLAEHLKQPFVVENKPGAGGAVAASEVVRAEPDGYTLLFTASWHSTASAIKKSLPYDALKDFTFISTFTTYGMMFGVKPDSPFKRMEDLITHAKANPGKLTFYSVGIGSAHHLIGEWLNALTGAQLVHVPYKGSALAFPDFIAGRVDLMVDTMTFALTQAKGGKVRPLAITSAEPMSELPGVPTASRSVPGLEYESWLGVLGPRAMSPQLLDRLNREVRAVVAQPDVAARLRELGAIPRASSPEEFRARCEREIARFTEIVETRKIPRE